MIHFSDKFKGDDFKKKKTTLWCLLVKEYVLIECILMHEKCHTIDRKNHCDWDVLKNRSSLYQSNLICEASLVAQW